LIDISFRYNVPQIDMLAIAEIQRIEDKAIFEAMRINAFNMIIGEQHEEK